MNIDIQYYKNYYINLIINNYNNCGVNTIKALIL